MNEYFYYIAAAWGVTGVVLMTVILHSVLAWRGGKK